jgi:hypothetical protein
MLQLVTWVFIAKCLTNITYFEYYTVYNSAVFYMYTYTYRRLSAPILSYSQYRRVMKLFITWKWIWCQPPTWFTIGNFSSLDIFSSSAWHKITKPRKSFLFFVPSPNPHVVCYCYAWGHFWWLTLVLWVGPTNYYWIKEVWKLLHLSTTQFNPCRSIVHSRPNCFKM